MTRYFRYYLTALFLGIILGMVTTTPTMGGTQATPTEQPLEQIRISDDTSYVWIPIVNTGAQWSFAGYEYKAQQNDGVSAIIGYTNPIVPKGQSLEWVMAVNDSGRYIQSGWIKRHTDKSPRYFIEYKCSTVCQFIYDELPEGQITTYRVEVASTWCAYIANVPKTCIVAGDLGLDVATRAIYSGETSHTDANLGGTPTDHLRLWNLRFKQTTGSWLQVNTGDLVSITTAGTRYEASAGYSDSLTWTDNWTN